MKWISVDDGLPETRGTYLASDKEAVAELYYEVRAKLWLEVNSRNSEPFGGITHWMPLPPPPEFEK